MYPFLISTYQKVLSGQHNPAPVLSGCRPTPRRPLEQSSKRWRPARFGCCLSARRRHGVGRQAGRSNALTGSLAGVVGTRRDSPRRYAPGYRTRPIPGSAFSLRQNRGGKHECKTTAQKRITVLSSSRGHARACAHTRGGSVARTLRGRSRQPLRGGRSRPALTAAGGAHSGPRRLQGAVVRPVPPGGRSRKESGSDPARRPNEPVEDPQLRANGRLSTRAVEDGSCGQGYTAGIHA